MPREKVVKRTLADGSVREYRYGRATSARNVGAVITEYKESPAFTRLKPLTKRAYLRDLDHLKPYDRVAIDDIRRRHILKNRDDNAHRPGIANGIIKVWSIVLQFAVEREYILANPAARIDKLDLGEHACWPEAAIRYALTPGNLPEHLRRAVVLGLYTGQREGDCVKMLWDDYDGATVCVEQEKGRRKKRPPKLWIPCHADLRAELERWKEEGRADTVLTRATGEPWGETKAFTVIFSREVHRKDGRTKKRVHPLLEGLVFHGLRKAAAANLAEAGCSTQEIMAITGHRTLTEFERYTSEADQKRLASSAIVKLEEYRRRNTSPFAPIRGAIVGWLVG